MIIIIIKECFFVVLILLICFFICIFYQILKDKISIIEQVVAIILMIILFSSYIYTVVINPGIPSLKNFELVNKNVVEIKKCRECRNYIRMDRRTLHCYECGVCVEQHDHHCPWITKCVGRNNLFSFYIFLLSIVSSLLYLVVLTALYGGNINK